jgi:hypothetical protein
VEKRNNFQKAIGNKYHEICGRFNLIGLTDGYILTMGRVVYVVCMNFDINLGRAAFGRFLMMT